jgi:DNA topoisomerase I
MSNSVLIIVESPSKAKTISAILSKTKGDTKYIVKASVGHIRGLSKANKNTDGKKLEIGGIDIDNNFGPIFEIDDGKKAVVSELRSLAKSNKDGILFATDEDREGEAISWHLAEVLGVNPSKVRRMVFHEITEKAILEAIKNPRPLDTNLVAAQQARQVLDKLVGFKLSPVLWSVLGDYHLSAGRVQSPALRIISERENEIKAFKSTEYWEIEAQFSPQKLNNSTKNENQNSSSNSTNFNSQKEQNNQTWQKIIQKFAGI